MLFKGFILKIALKIVRNVWSIQVLHTGGEAFLSEKCTGMTTVHKYFGLETPELFTPSKQWFSSRTEEVLPEITALFPSPRLLSSINAKILTCLLTSLREYYQFKHSKPQTELKSSQPSLDLQLGL